MPHALADAEVRKLLGCITNPIHSTCFALMYACGLRIGEAAALEISAIDRNHLLHIIGRGNTERLVPLPTPMLGSLRRLWKIHRNPRWLFPNRAGTNPIGRGTLNRTFSAAAQAAGITGSATPHSLRHGYATRLLENHIDAAVVQLLLGHSSIATTKVYLHLTEPVRVSLTTVLDKVMTGL